ncbi:MAG: hypothetical protein D6707_12725, partial [Bacteroidetes bacterium]
MKKIYTVILAVLCLQGNAQFSGGSGTTSDPYVIANKNDLATLSNNSSYWDKHFIQTADIMLTAADFQTGGIFYNNGEGFSPVGTYGGTSFTGSYNGKGHVIDSLYINRPSANFIGLFAYIGSGATVDSLGVTNVNITGQSFIGGFCGDNAGTVSNCYSTGSVSGNSEVGGFCGVNVGTVSNCY